MEAAHAYHPFRLPRFSEAGLGRALFTLVGPALERMLAFPALNAIYAQSRQARPEKGFCERTLETMGVTIEVCPSETARIPASGPLVVVANHPVGGIEGLVLAVVLQRVRRDVKLMANYLLSCMPEMRDISIFVDPFGGSEAAAHNVTPMRDALRWLRQGGCLGVFPAGEVAHFNFHAGCVTDPPWDDSIARLVRASGAAVLPVFFEGRNRLRFQLLGLVHRRLRTLLLPREFLNKRSHAIRVDVGSVVPFNRLASIRDSAELTEYLRLRTYLLKNRAALRAREGTGAAHGASKAAQPIVGRLPVDHLVAEIAGLPSEDLLLSSGLFRVFCSPAQRIQGVLQEIGRLREVTFRAVGEGTGREIDLDRFDPHYRHLFVWHDERQELVGAYRLAPTDEIEARFGVRGLYTHTLFRYGSTLLSRMGPALELGRSFVVGEYQRSHSPLMLLWKGIGRFVAARPRYRVLFGAVSISDEYQSMTKQLLMSFLHANDFQCDLARLVTPRNPPRRQRFRDCDERCLSAVVHDLDAVDELVREIEGDGREMPVLLRQYLKLNAKLLGFNRDPDFGDVLDGLLLIDLTRVARPILTRYFGKENAETFLAFHNAAGARAL